MLKRFKKIFGMVQEEEQENRHPTRSVKQRLSHRKLETKVAYKYPRHTPFRFPVIPDEDQKQGRQKRYTYRSRQDQIGEQRKTKDNKKFRKAPFTPTEVASPIYGYKRKAEDDLYNLPAFVRKQRNQENKDFEQQESNIHLQNDLIQKNVIKEQNEQVEQINKLNTVALHKVASGMATPIETYPQEEKILESQIATSTRQEKVQSTTAIGDNVKIPIGKINHFDSNTMPFHLLNDPVEKNSEDRQWVKEQQILLEQTLTHFNVKAKVVNATQGPSVTRFEVQPELGVKVSRVRNLSDDIKMNMAARDIRIEAPIPGKNTIGIEVPNLNAQTVGLQEIIDTNAFRDNGSPLTIGLGLSIEGKPHITTIDKMPHGLIAGATGSGKSVCINTILISLLYKSGHEDVKLLLIDPKMVELAPYNDIPHLVSPVITDVKAATAALKWAVEEMEERYEQFVQAGVRDIHRFNKRATELELDKMPHIVIIIDELADLMMASPQDVEDAICRIAQKARACGMHLILATQRPSVDVITGLIKANIPTRIAFSVSSQVDSRTIIDTNGAERLLGKGDMLFIENGSGNSVRLQGAFVSDDEIERVTNYVKSLAEPNYLFHQEQLIRKVEADEEVDELFEDVIQFILEHDQASTSLLQRHFRIGYNRAARLIDTLESKGMISEQNGSKPRDVLFTIDQLEQFI